MITEDIQLWILRNNYDRVVGVYSSRDKAFDRVPASLVRCGRFSGYEKSWCREGVEMWGADGEYYTIIPVILDDPTSMDPSDHNKLNERAKEAAPSNG